MISYLKNLEFLLRQYIKNPDLTQLYAKVREDEKTNKDILIEFEDNYPDVLNGDNLTDILKAARAKKKG